MSTPLSFAHCIYKCFFLVPMLFTANLQKQRNVQTCLPCVEKSIFLWYFCRQIQTLLCKAMQKRFCVLQFFVHGKADLFNGRIVMLATNFFCTVATFCDILPLFERCRQKTSRKKCKNGFACCSFLCMERLTFSTGVL